MGKIDTTLEYERRSWEEYYNYIVNISDNQMRTKFEIEANGKHIGWVSCYYDLDYIENSNKVLAIGVEIPDKESRGLGNGTKALMQFIKYLSRYNHKQFLFKHGRVIFR